MTRADVLAYAQTLEFIPPCLHWGTCQACGVTVWWAANRYDDKPPYHKHGDGVVGYITDAGFCVLTDAEREGRVKPCTPVPPPSMTPEAP